MCLAVPGQVVSILDAEVPELRCAQVDFGGIRKQVNLSFTPDARTGDYVLVHVGFALSVLDEVEARRIFEDLKTLGELSELEPET